MLSLQCVVMNSSAAKTQWCQSGGDRYRCCPGGALQGQSHGRSVRRPVYTGGVAANLKCKWTDGKLSFLMESEAAVLVGSSVAWAVDFDPKAMLVGLSGATVAAEESARLLSKDALGLPNLNATTADAQ